MKRREIRQQRTRARRLQRQRTQLEPGHKSRYARKAEWCAKHGVWGWEVPHPKPWGGGA